MRRLRLIAIALVAVALVSLSGCDRVWTTTFRDVYDLAGWHLSPYDMDANYAIDENGLMLDAMSAGSPFAFSGDVMLTVVFEMFSTATNPMKDLSILLSSSPQYLYLSFRDLNTVGDEMYVFMENNLANKVEFPGPVPGIRYIGSNTVVFTKKAGRVKIELNGTELYDEAYSEYNAEFSTPRMGAFVRDGSGYVIFKLIRVQYSGEVLPTSM